MDANPLDKVYSRRDVTALQKLVYTTLLAHADARGEVQVGQTAIAVKLGTCQRSILRSLNGLRAAGLISIAQVGVKGAPARLRLNAA